MTGAVGKILSEKEAADLSSAGEVIKAWQIGQISIRSGYIVNKGFPWRKKCHSCIPFE